MRAHGTASPDRGRSQAGFTLLELMVGLVLFSFGTLGLAAMTVGLQRQTTLAQLRTERTAAVVAAVERVRSFDFDSLTAGSQAAGPYKVSWSVAPTGRYVKQVRVITVGPGLAYGPQGAFVDPARADTLDYPVLKP